MINKALEELYLKENIINQVIIGGSYQTKIMSYIMNKMVGESK